MFQYNARTHVCHALSCDTCVFPTVVSFQDMVSLRWLKNNVNARCKWIPCEDWFKTLNYCSKEFTRNGEIFRKNCRENRKKKESSISDEELIDLRIKELVEESSKGMVGWCWEVGHPLKDCW